jgi:hypothetical protein
MVVRSISTSLRPVTVRGLDGCNKEQRPEGVARPCVGRQAGAALPAATLTRNVHPGDCRQVEAAARRLCWPGLGRIHDEAHVDSALQSLLEKIEAEQKRATNSDPWPPP